MITVTSLRDFHVFNLNCQFEQSFLCFCVVSWAWVSMFMFNGTNLESQLVALSNSFKTLKQYFQINTSLCLNFSRKIYSRRSCYVSRRSFSCVWVAIWMVLAVVGYIFVSFKFIFALALIHLQVKNLIIRDLGMPYWFGNGRIVSGQLSLLMVEETRNFMQNLILLSRKKLFCLLSARLLFCVFFSSANYNP